MDLHGQPVASSTVYWVPFMPVNNMGPQHSFPLLMSIIKFPWLLGPNPAPCRNSRSPRSLKPASLTLTS